MLLIFSFFVAFSIVVVAALVNAQVPPTYTSFHPELHSVQYGLVVQESKMQSLTMSEINFFNLTSSVKATAYFNQSLNDIGWNYLYVKANKQLLSSPTTISQAYYYAGVLEGALTVTHILDLHKKTILENRKRFLTSPSTSGVRDGDGAQVWVQNQISWNQQQIAANPTDPFWSQLSNQFQQIQGIADGASLDTSILFNFTFFDIYALNLDMEWNAIEAHVNLLSFKHKKNPQFDENSVPASVLLEREQKKAPVKKTHCSAFVKIVQDDILASQIVWGPFDIMIRYYKTYDFQTKIVFSSYPAMIVSNDDWYTTSNRLTTMETTNGVYNQSLYALVKHESVSEFNRVMIANYLSSDCIEWTSLFALSQSGTYNNGWICLNPKRWAPVNPATITGLLVIAEQIPGLVATEDVTQLLFRQNYFGSYNIPKIEIIRRLSGFSRMEQEFGSFFSYTQAPRARIFAAKAAEVIDLGSFQNMVRWNDFEHSPLSLIPNCSGCPNDQCSPKYSAMNAISSRGDLAPVGSKESNGTNCLGPLSGYMARQQFGGLDAKISSLRNSSSMVTTAISGPTNVQQPTFEFSDKDWIPVMPKKWNFPWVTFYQPSE